MLHYQMLYNNLQSSSLEQKSNLTNQIHSSHNVILLYLYTTVQNRVSECMQGVAIHTDTQAAVSHASSHFVKNVFYHDSERVQVVAVKSQIDEATPIYPAPQKVAEKNACFYRIK